MTTPKLDQRSLQQLKSEVAKIPPQRNPRAEAEPAQAAAMGDATG